MTVILPIISDRINWNFIIFSFAVRDDTLRDLILIVGHCDMYFMVQ